MVGKEAGVEVLLRLNSTVVHEGETQTDIQEYKGQMFAREAAYYIRYVEDRPEVGTVSNTLKVEREQISIIRHGAVRMKHVYRLGERTTSSYQTKYGALNMEAKTTKLAWQMFEKSSIMAELILAYELTLQEELVGQFTLELHMVRV